MNPILGVFIAIFGAAIGSFLSAVLSRLHAGESFLVGRSHCVFCQHELSAADLVPILSYASLGGRCRYCRRVIDPQYVLLECATAVLFLLAANHDLHPGAAISPLNLAQLLLHWYEIAALEIVFVYDLRHMLVLPEVTLPATFIGGLGAVALGLPWWSAVLGAGIGAGVFLLQRLISRGAWVGSGDVFIGLMLGAMLGWERVLFALFLAYVAGAMVGVVLLASGKATRKTRIPFGTFLAAAAIVALLYGEPLIAAYRALLI